MTFGALAACIFAGSGLLGITVIVHDIWVNRDKILAALAYEPIP